MHKSVFTFALLASSLVMLAIMPLLNNNSFFPNTVAMAQEYDDKYSQYPTKENKYECRTGPFQGFFVSSVEFCDAKHDKKDKDRDRDDNRTGTQGPQGPQGPNGTQGIPGPQGPPGNTTGLVNQTEFTCVACLLDALLKLETGAVTVDVNITIPGVRNGPVLNNVTVPLTIDLDVATLLQQQLAVSLGLGADATIFEICAAIDAGATVNIGAIITAIDTIIGPLILAEVTAQITDIVSIINATGGLVPPATLATILASINVTGIIGDINADITASLNLFNDCRGVLPPPPTLAVTKTVACTTTNANLQPACDVIVEGIGFPNLQITPNQFNITITGNNPNPSQFNGSSTAVVVTLDPGPYNVSDIRYPSVTNDLVDVLQTFPGISSIQIEAPAFSGDCTVIPVPGFNQIATGTIAAGESQTCNIVNAFRLNA